MLMITRPETQEYIRQIVLSLHAHHWPVPTDTLDLMVAGVPEDGIYSGCQAWRRRHEGLNRLPGWAQFAAWLAEST